MSPIARIEADEIRRMTEPDMKELLHEMHPHLSWRMRIIEDDLMVTICVPIGKSAELIARGPEVVHKLERKAGNVLERPHLAVRNQVQRTVLFQRFQIRNIQFGPQVRGLQLDGPLP